MNFTLKRLTELNRKKILEHFLRLDINSRSSRFCSPMTDENIGIYVKKIDFKNGIFGVFNDNLDIIGVGECVFFKEKEKQTAEVAFTIEKDYQKNGLGNRLMKRVVQYANSRDVHELQMYCLRSNKAVLHLAKKYNLVPQYEGSEMSGVVTTPQVMPLISGFNEQFEENVATLELAFTYQKKLITDQIKRMNINSIGSNSCLSKTI